MRVLVAGLALAAVLLPAGVGAQSLSLTEAQALARLSDESPRVRAARAAVEVARADVAAAGRWPNPRVTFNRESVLGIAENYLTVTQALPVGGRRELDVSVANSRVEATLHRVDDRLRRLHADLRLAFTDLWVTQARERELASSRDRLRTLSDVLGRREAGGESSGFDRLRAERSVIDVDADRAAAAAERARAEGLLTGFFASTLPVTNGIEAIRPDQPPTTLPPIDDLVARAELVRGDLLALALEREAASFMAQGADRRRIPEPEIVAGTKSSSAGTGDVGSVFGVHFSLPLFDHGGPERAAAHARAAQVDAEAEALRLAIRTEIGGWRAAVIERRAIAGRYRAAVNASTDDIERIALVSYESGESGILELLDAHRTASSARVRQAMLDAAVREAEIELEFVSGWEIP